MEFGAVDGRLFLEDPGNVLGVETILLLDAEMFGDKNRGLL